MQKAVLEAVNGPIAKIDHSDALDEMNERAEMMDKLMEKIMKKLTAGPCDDEDKENEWMQDFVGSMPSSLVDKIKKLDK